MSGLSVSDVGGFGRRKRHIEFHRGAEYAVGPVPRTRLEIAVSDGGAAAVIETIARVARTGKIGDGKLFVLDVEQAIRIRTGEAGEDAIRWRGTS